jgi:phosphoribosylformimino-5-aminoimidazole carboxamide ribotide isomerase
MDAAVARMRATVISMTKFRPCIDLHQGQVKQIVGGSLRDDGAGPTENFVSDRPAGWFAETFRDDRLTGGHVIKLGPGNDLAAREALAAYSGGLQIGGGIHVGNAAEWLAAGASHVIVTSALFDADGKFQEESLRALVRDRPFLPPDAGRLDGGDEPLANADRADRESRHAGPPCAVL